MSDNSENAKLIEDINTTTDLDWRDRELSLREREVSAQIEYYSHSKRSHISPLLLAGVAAVAGILGSITGAFVQYITEERKFELEFEKFQFQVFAEAIKTDSVEQATENLRFFVETGFLADRNDQLREFLAEIDRAGPTLPDVKNTK